MADRPCPGPAGRGRLSSQPRANYNPVVPVHTFDASSCHYCSTPIASRDTPDSTFRDVAGHLAVSPGFAGGTSDHKVPRSRGGTDAPVNLVPACVRCNSAKGVRSYLDFVLDPAGETVARVGPQPNFESWSHRASRRRRSKQAWRQP